MKSKIIFNNVTIPYKVFNGMVYVAVRPLCESLGVEYKTQYRKLSKNDRFPTETLNILTDQIREYFCLAETKVYGWLFTLDSNNSDFIKYQDECYNLLYNFFKGSIIGRNELLKQKKEIQTLIQEKVKVLNDNSFFHEYLELKAEEMRIGKLLKENDNQTMNTINEIF